MKSLFWYKEDEGDSSVSILYDDINKTFEDSDGNSMDENDVRYSIRNIDDNFDYALCPNVTLKEVYDAIKTVENSYNEEYDDGPWTT